MNLDAIGSLPVAATNLADQVAAGVTLGSTTLGRAVSLRELTTVATARDVGVVGLLSTTVKGSDLALGLVQAGDNLCCIHITLVRTNPAGVVDAVLVVVTGKSNDGRTTQAVRTTAEGIGGTRRELSVSACV